MVCIMTRSDLYKFETSAQGTYWDAAVIQWLSTPPGLISNAAIVQWL